jgi:hypothetical protein
MFMIKTPSFSMIASASEISSAVSSDVNIAELICSRRQEM